MEAQPRVPIRGGTRVISRCDEKVVIRAAGLSAEGLHRNASVVIPPCNTGTYPVHARCGPVDVFYLGLFHVEQVGREFPRTARLVLKHPRVFPAADKPAPEAVV